MNTPKSQSKLREHLYAFASPPWQALVSWSFLDQGLMWLYPSPCEDFDLEMELSKLSLHLLPWPLTMTLNLSVVSSYPSLACWIFIVNLLNLCIAFRSRFGYSKRSQVKSLWGSTFVKLKKTNFPIFLSIPPPLGFSLYNWLKLLVTCAFML
jgi:hypothetical protein